VSEPEFGDVGEASETRREYALRLVCPHSRIISILFSVLLIFTLLSLASVYALEPPNRSYYTAVMTAVMDGVLVIIAGVLLYFCRKFHMQEL